MTLQEFKAVREVLAAAYGTTKILTTRNEIQVWYAMLMDIPYEDLMLAVSKWIATSKWRPSIAELRKTVCDIRDFQKPDWGLGWKQVNQAISRYGFLRGEEALESFDDITKECVKRLNWQSLCKSTDREKDRANFRMLYEELAVKKNTERLLPQRLKELIDNNRKNYMIDTTEEHDE